jgi:fucose 4-O-acetylase-like acetyltransferase
LIVWFWYSVSVYITGKYFGYYYDTTSYTPDTIVFRVGVVLLLNSIISFVSQKIESIPKIIILVGRNTLLIYVMHLMILFGSAWNPGLSLLFAGSLNVTVTIIVAILMIILMLLMVHLLSKFKFRNKQLVT